MLKISTTRLQPNARVPLKETCAYDASGKKYKSPVSWQDELGSNGTDEVRELVFAVPVGTQLSKVELSPGNTLELQ